MSVFTQMFSSPHISHVWLQNPSKANHNNRGCSYGSVSGRVKLGHFSKYFLHYHRDLHASLSPENTSMYLHTEHVPLRIKYWSLLHFYYGAGMNFREITNVFLSTENYFTTRAVICWIFKTVIEEYLTWVTRIDVGWTVLLSSGRNLQQRLSPIGYTHQKYRSLSDWKDNVYKCHLNIVFIFIDAGVHLISATCNFIRLSNT